MTLDFYGDNIFRVFQDNAGGIIRNPEAKPEAQILVDNPRMSLSKLDIETMEAQSVSQPGISAYRLTKPLRY